MVRVMQMNDNLIVDTWLQAGIITFSTSIIKGGVEKFALKQPIFLVNLSHIKRNKYMTDALILSLPLSTLSIRPRYVSELSL